MNKVLILILMMLSFISKAEESQGATPTITNTPDKAEDVKTNTTASGKNTTTTAKTPSTITKTEAEAIQIKTKDLNEGKTKISLIGMMLAKINLYHIAVSLFIISLLTSMFKEFNEKEKEEPIIIQIKENIAKINDDSIRKKFHNELKQSKHNKRDLPLLLNKTKLPYNDSSKEMKEIIKKINIEEARKILDENHYGMEKVKDKIIDYIHKSKFFKDNRLKPILILGPPGVGKTTIIKAIAKAFGFDHDDDYCKIFECSGATWESFIGGHPQFVGSTYGYIISAMLEAGRTSMVIGLNEIDKASYSTQERTHASQSLLGPFDNLQSKNFMDAHIQHPIDISNIFFILTANSLKPFSPEFLDRVHVIKLEGYDDNDKKEIIKKYFVKQAQEKIKKNNLDFELSLTDDQIDFIVQQDKGNKGIRNIEESVDQICTNAFTMKAESKEGGNPVKEDKYYIDEIFKRIKDELNKSTSN